jgi:hypothetical protein
MGIGTFFDMLTIVSVLAFLLSQAARGNISADLVAVALVILVVLVAFARAARMSLPRLVFRIALPVLAVWGLVSQYDGGDPRVRTQILASLGTILIMLLGLYVMVSGPFQRRR